MVLINELAKLQHPSQSVYKFKQIFILKNIVFRAIVLCIHSERSVEKHEHYLSTYLILIVAEPLQTEMDCRFFFEETGYRIGHSQATYMRIWN